MRVKCNSASTSVKLLIDNARVIARPAGRTCRQLLLPIRDKAPSPPLLAVSTITSHFQVNMAASPSRVAAVYFDNLIFEREYEPGKAYGQTTTANIWEVG
jgi:hypothetical protein